MIKKLIGLAVAAAVIAVIVLASIRREQFHSMVEWDSTATQQVTEPQLKTTQQPVAPTTAEQTDSTTKVTPDTL